MTLTISGRIYTGLQRIEGEIIPPGDSAFLQREYPNGFTILWLDETAVEELTRGKTAEIIT